MKWLRFRHGGAIKFGTLEGATGDRVAVRAGDMFGDNQATGEMLDVAAIEWLTPTVPGKLLCIWNNFHAAAEKNGWAIPAEPLYLLKGANAHCAHKQPIVAPTSYDGRVVYEGELVIVIGRTAKNVSEADAPAHIFGYTCGNDVTALEIINRDPGFQQWVRAKSFDTFGVFGPVIETDFIPDGVELVTTLNGRERQRYPLSDMIVKPTQLVARISQDMTLQPGDVICCGTSLGVMPMKPGSTVEVTIAGIGTLSNEYKAA